MRVFFEDRMRARGSLGALHSLTDVDELMPVRVWNLILKLMLMPEPMLLQLLTRLFAWCVVACISL